MLIGYSGSKLMQTTMSLHESKSDKFKRFAKKYRHGHNLYKIRECVKLSNSDFLVTDSRSHAVSVMRTQGANLRIKGEKMRELRLPLAAQFHTNQLLFEPQEITLQTRKQLGPNCVMYVEDEVSVVSVDEDKRELRVYTLQSMSVDETIDYYLDRDDQLTALKIIQQTGGKQTKIWEWQLKNGKYLNSG